MNEYKKILSCWHKLEHFSPAAIAKGKNVELLVNEPWNIPLKSSNPKKTFEYTIYLGVFESSIVTEFITDFFNDKIKDENERSSKICFASLKLNSKGCYINESIGISTLPWALAQLENGHIKTNDWSDKFENIKEEITNDLDYIFNETKTNEFDEVIKIAISASLNKLQLLESKIETLCGWSIKPKTNIYVKRVEKFKSKKEVTQADLLNSFFIKDLEKISSEFEKSSSPKSFLAYLNGTLNKKTKRTDLLKNKSALRESLTPLDLPDGCWTSEYLLNLMQQYAVNNIFNNLAESDQKGLFSVNGPPGTGKTTLLRDIIAPIIVKRAKELSQITNPSEAFTKVGAIEVSDNFSPFIYEPIKNLTNAGIIVASSNNGAVENISKELPLKKEVSIYSEQISYFREVAESCINKDNWGLISAVLGNKQNRSNLISSLWFDFDQKEIIGLQKALKENKVLDNSNWKNVVIEFNNKLHEVKQEKERLELFRKGYIQFEKVKNKKNQMTIKLTEYRNDFLALKKKFETQLKTVNQLKERKTDVLNELSIIKENKPTFFIYWFNKKIRKEYKESIQLILTEYNNIAGELKKENIIFNELQSLNEQAKNTLDNHILKLETCIKKYDTLSDEVKLAKNELGKNFADNQYWDNVESKESQDSCPWYSLKLKELQSELFIISLKLNEAFILNANSTSSRISTTLAAFFEYLSGNIKASHAEVKAMWNTFFLVIPVVSTTFASVQTMLKDLDKEDIPWLFIDEAGQAVPQAAAGAIWRSKRVVVVGDPLQIEPVVTIPNLITNKLREHFGLNEEHINSEFSVQSIADRINPLGSHLNLNGKTIWIGIPLRVHRRCLNPMFKISNQIAYDNTMFLSTLIPKKIDVNFKTAFIHCKGNVDGRHFVKEQADIIEKILVNEISSVKNLPDIFVITPFNEISYKLNSNLYGPLINEVKKHIQIDGEIFGNWLKKHIGTVHTFQGKQAAGVILCLGLDDNTKGAASWASQKPNLLNVAITRAKYRFVAIGDRNIWLKQRHFNALKILES
jgi:superfamily I DNA and/or RNA helicase